MGTEFRERQGLGKGQNQGPSNLLVTSREEIRGQATRLEMRGVKGHMLALPCPAAPDNLHPEG